MQHSSGHITHGYMQLLFARIQDYGMGIDIYNVKGSQGHRVARVTQGD